MSNEAKDITSIYKDQLKRMTKRVYPNISEVMMDKALDYSIEKRYKAIPAVIDNNYTKKQVDIWLRDLTNYILAKEPICTVWGVMFKKHGVVPNPTMDMITQFMDQRGIHKAQMFQYPKGSEEFAKYNLLQLLDKLDANATYGALSNKSCLLYNLYVAASITAQGREFISTATMFFEMFLSNGVKFGSLEEILTFIDNVVGEKEERQFNDNEMLDRNITVEECFAKIVYTIGDFRFGKIKWVPNEEDLDIIWLTLNRLTQEDINRLYYKNNLFAFMENKAAKRAVVYILRKLKKPYLNPNEVPDEIKVELDTFQDILSEYVYYHYQILDKIDRCDNMPKNVAVISDTDSAIVCLDGWYRYVLDIVKDEDLEVGRTYVDAFSYVKDGSIKTRAFTIEKNRLDYDFFDDKIIELQREIHAMEIIPQDNLRYSIINIMSYIIGNLSNDYLYRYAELNYSQEKDRKCLMYLKNEFLFKRAMLTNVKKNYATIQEIQEGNMVPKEKSLDLKGLQIKKSTVADKTTEEMERIIYEDILSAPEIDQLKIVKELAILEKGIYKSILSGSKEYYKPSIIKALASYADPMTQQGVKAAYIWNLVRDDELEAIDLTARNRIDIAKVKINADTLEKIKDKYPSTYEKINKVLHNNDLLKFYKPTDSKRKETGEISAIAIPDGVKTPDWILEFIDYDTIINDNLKVFPIESVGITRARNSVNYSNVIKIG